MNHTPIYISRDDCSQLRRLVAISLYTRTNATLQRLREELDRATVVDPAGLPPGVVAMESTVVIEDLRTGEIETYTLSYPDQADADLGRISVLAPVGIALLGCREGDIVRWPTPGGIRELKLRQVTTAAALTGATA
jgi:regulator of nucleoside diphosphate kinase